MLASLVATLLLLQNPAAPVRADSGPLPQPPDSGKLKITPLLAPAYNPEMQFLIAGGVLLSWKVGPNPLRVQRSTLSSTVSLSTTGAINVNTSLNSFWNQDRFRLSAEHGSEGGAVEVITGRLTARGVAFHEDAEALLLGNANPGLHKVPGGHITPAYGLQALVHRTGIHHQDVLLPEEALEHLERCEM